LSTYGRRENVCVAGYVIEEENKGNDGEEERGRDHAWHMSIGLNAGHKKKTRGCICASWRMTGGKVHGKRQKKKKRKQGQHDKLVGIVWFGILMMMNMRRPLQGRPFMRFPEKKTRQKNNQLAEAEEENLKRETEKTIGSKRHDTWESH
jgi:hypothetical protein